MKKITVLIIILTLIMTACSSKNDVKSTDSTENDSENIKAKVIKVDKVKKRELSKSTLLSGDIISDNIEVISAVVSGTIKTIDINVGDIVQQNDIIAKLDDELLNLKLEQANIQYESSKLQLESAKRTYERINNLYQNGAVTKTDYENANDALQHAKLSFKSANNNKNQMNYQSKNMKIKASIQGTISNVYQKSGSAVASGTPICEIVNTNDMIVSTGVSESQISIINKGQKVDIEVPSINQTFRGTVESIAPTPRMDKTYPIRVHIDNATSQLKIGMFAQLKINTTESFTALTIPKIAVINEEGEDYVFVVQDKKAIRKTIELGTTYEDYFEIKNGLLDGDTIVTSGQNYLADGDTISIIK